MQSFELEINNDKNREYFEEENIEKGYKNFAKVDEKKEEEESHNSSFIIIENLIDKENKTNELEMKDRRDKKEKNTFQKVTHILNKQKYTFLSLFIYILFIFCISVSTWLYNLREVKHNYILLSFEFKPIPQNYSTNEFYVFLTSVYATYLVLLIILVFMLLIGYSLIKNENNFSQIYFQDFLICLHIFLICFITKSILGIFFLMELFLLYCDLFLTIIGLIFLIYFYLKGKSIKYNNIFNLLSQNFFPSVLLAFEFYTLLYLICRILTKEKCESYNKNYKIKIELIANLIYFLSGVSIMLYYEDIIYPLTLVIIETGLLTKAGSSKFILVILNIFFLSFMFYSSFFVILTNKSRILKLNIKKSENRISSV